MPKESTIDPSEGVPRLPQRLLAIADISCDMNVRVEEGKMWARGREDVGWGRGMALTRVSSGISGVC